MELVTSFSFDSPWWYFCNWWLFFSLTAELVQSLKSGAEWQSESFKSCLYLGKRYRESSLWRRRRWGGGCPVYEAVNQRCPSQASGVKIVQESGRIIKRATQIVIKSRPRVIIRVWEIESEGGRGLKNVLLVSKTRLALLYDVGLWRASIFDEKDACQLALKMLEEIWQLSEWNFLL